MESDPKTVLGHLNQDRVIELTRDILRIPSFSGQEKDVAEHLAARMDDLGMEVTLQEVQDGRPNVIGVLRGSGGGQSILFNGHMDHNMVCEGWTKDPFGAVIEDGWLYGIGVANMKAGDAACLAAVEAIKRSGIRRRGDVTLEFVVGELQGGIGTLRAIEAGVRADMFIDAEPTELGILTMHAGVVQARIHVLGEMRHFTTLSGRVVHAIEKMVAVMNALGRSYTPIPHGGWLTFDPKPEYEGLPQLNIGVIRGGITKDYLAWRPSLVPDRCSITVDIRIVPGQSPESVRRDLSRLLSRLRENDPDLNVELEMLSPEEHAYMPPFEVSRNSYIVQSARRAHLEVFGEEPQVGGLSPQKYCGSDAAHLAAAGIPGILYGPGGKYLSRPDERVELAAIYSAARVYALVAAEACVLPK